MEILIGLILFIIGAALASLYFLKKNSTLQIEVKTWQTKFELTEISSDKFKLEQERLQLALNLQFKDLAQKILDEKISKFDIANTKQSDQSFKQLEGLLNPLKDKIKDFEKRVEEGYTTERLERNNLKNELNRLLDLNQTMSKEAHNLTLALKGENKTQGNWGEMILENILERSGLRKGQEYFTQETLHSPQGDILRPDVIVKLPDGKHLIVDSKMTLISYEASVSATTDEDSKKYALAHVESLKRHINQLSEKKYHLAEEVISPDFVMLFMPLEPAFALAFKMKPELFEDAWDKNVAIVSPTTLLSTLRTVASLWKQERQQQNALEIAKRGGELYDKFAGLVKDFETLGERINSAQNAHADVMTKIKGSRGLIKQVEKLKELGAKAEKSLPLALED